MMLNWSAFMLAALNRQEAFLWIVALGPFCSLVIGALLLQLSVGLNNRFIIKTETEEGQELIPRPSLLKGMGILILSAVVHLMIAWVLNAISIGDGLFQEGSHTFFSGNQIPLNLLTLVFGFFGTAALLTAMLPATLKRSIVVALTQYLFFALAGPIIVFMFLVAFLMLGIYTPS